MAVSLSPFAGAGWQFFDNNGVILSGGKLYVYAAGTTSSATTYTSSTGSTANTNPIILNSSGRLANEIWLTTGLNYKFILKTSADVLIGTWDNIPAGTTDVADLQAALASNTGAGMIGYTQGSSGSFATTVQSKLRETVSVFDFMTAAQIADVQSSASTMDVTAAIQNAYSYISTIYGGTLVFPRGNYIIKSQLVFNDLYWKTLIFEGACIYGASLSTSYDAVFKIVNAENFKLVGSLTVAACTSGLGWNNNPNLYGCAFSIQAAPGGAIEPTNGIVAFGEINGLTVTKARCGLKVGSYNNDAQIAEFAFIGLQTPFCPTGMEFGGSQTIVTFTNPSLCSSYWPTLTSPVYKTIIQKGGGITILGGELVNDAVNGVGATVAEYVLDFQPATTVLYGNAFGTFNAIGTIIEHLSPFGVVHNPSSLSSPLSFLSKINLAGSYGYSGSMSPSVSYLSVDEPTYEGKIVIDEGCNFYQGSGASTRSNPTINCSVAPNTLVSVGEKSFTKGYPAWMQGVAGGQLLHGLVLGIMAYANSTSYTSGIQTLIFNQKASGGNFERWYTLYNSTTGIFTVPTNAPQLIKMEASVLTPGVTGDIFIYDITNSRYVSYGQVAGGIANVFATIPNPTAGQQFAVKLNLSGPVTFGGNITNNLAIYISN